MSHLDNIQKAVPQPPVITLSGFPGAGKTTLASLFDAPIFIQAENASTVFENSHPDDQPSFFPILPKPSKQKQTRPSEVVLEQLRELLSGKHNFKTLVIDTVTSMNDLFEAEVVEFDPAGADNIGEAANGFNKGYNVSAAMHARVRSACEHLRKKGMSIIFLSHTGIVKMKNRPDVGEYTAFTIDMPEKSRHFYTNYSDAVIYLKTEAIVQGTETNRKGQVTKFGRVFDSGDRVAITSSDGVVGYIDAKNRYGMPQEIKVPHGTNPLIQYISFINKKEEPKT